MNIQQTALNEPSGTTASTEHLAYELKVLNNLKQKWKVDTRIENFGGGKGVQVVISGFTSRSELAQTDVQVLVLLRILALLLYSGF